MSRGDYGKISIFVLVDALGWECVRSSKFLTDLLPFRRPVETVLGFSSAAIPTILSGQMPEVHSHWCLFKRGGLLSCFSWTAPLRLLPRKLRENHRTRRSVERMTRALFRISGYFCLYEVPVSMLHRLDYVERRDLWQPGALADCSTILDTLSARSIPFYASGWRGTDEKRLEATVRGVAQSPVRCCFLYFSELDAALHTFGLDSAQAEAELVAASVRIRRLVARTQELYSEVELFVFSDHGMTSVVEGHDLQSVMASTGPRRSRYMAFYDSTMARFWPKDDPTGEIVRETLSSVPYGRVLSSDELSELGLGFNGNRYGEIIFVMDPGHVVVPSFVSTGVPRAMHGFHPSDPFSRACFLSRDEPESAPGHIKDMHSFFRTRLGLERE
ncbi:MAG: alkaline phosphatase family protein [Candidatus Eiseniibacteriota bacterium]|nr:MAG: alkaline phosphatase family protein [Candidatus Eisenbacteria bacterium]